jgi:hypothetical protein
MRNHGDNQATSLLGRREAVVRDYAPIKDGAHRQARSI